MSYGDNGVSGYGQSMAKDRTPPLDDAAIDEYSRRIGNYVEQSSKKKGWSQKQLAAEMEVGAAMVNKLLKGNAEWTNKYLLAAEKALKVPAGLLFAIGNGIPVQDLARLAGRSDAPPRLLPSGFTRFLGDYGDDVSSRERRWLESVLDFTEEPAGDNAVQFWHKLWRTFREREPSGS